MQLSTSSLVALWSHAVALSSVS
ncbi:unnamed protein product, partial [Adineta steineri]